MRELSLHILDIAQNSIAAKASLLEILVEESPTQDLLTIQITDNGKGMPPQLVATVTDPFTSSRTTRKVGLGLPLFKAAAEACGGFFHIWSQEERGTQVKAAFQFSHIDRAPPWEIWQAPSLPWLLLIPRSTSCISTNTRTGRWCWTLGRSSQCWRWIL